MRTVGPFLHANNVSFKSVKNLDLLSDINSGLKFGYGQIGKFITIYPRNDAEARSLCIELDKLTSRFSAVDVPFDTKFSNDSSVHYRYGAFHSDTDTNGIGYIFDPDGNKVADDRSKARPDWLGQELFPDRPHARCADGLLSTRFRVFKALTQRGKGGTYLAFDVEKERPDLCLIKEGRKGGEVFWDGHDGFDLVENEALVLKNLAQKVLALPRPICAFTDFGNQYIAMELIVGQSLTENISRRKRRMSQTDVVYVARRVCEVLMEIHDSGWVWNDLKPSNILFQSDGSVRIVDFENAFRITELPRFHWRTSGYALERYIADAPNSADYYSLGSMMFFLLTARDPNDENLKRLRRLRRSLCPELAEFVEWLRFNPEDAGRNPKLVRSAVTSLTRLNS